MLKNEKWTKGINAFGFGVIVPTVNKIHFSTFRSFLISRLEDVFIQAEILFWFGKGYTINMKCVQ